QDGLPVVILGVANHGFLQRRNSVGRRVPDFSRVQQRGAVDHRIGRRLALRFAASQMNDGLSFVAEPRSRFIQLESRGLSDRSSKLTKTHDVSLPFLRIFIAYLRIPYKL